MTRAVVDANVLARSLTAPLGTSAALIHDAWLDGAYTLVTSEFCLTELRRTLDKPYFRQQLEPEMVTVLIDNMRRCSAFVPEPFQIKAFGVGSHWQDDTVMSTALSGAAQYLVTEDRDLLAARYHSGISIVSAGVFCELLAHWAKTDGTLAE